MQNNNQLLGFVGQQQVVSYLKKNNYHILDQNYRTFFGEIDIIAQKGPIISFIEVKTRKKIYFDVSTVINPSKQRKIIAAAREYITYYYKPNHIFQFDVALVHACEVTYIENAFYDEQAPL